MRSFPPHLLTLYLHATFFNSILVALSVCVYFSFPTSSSSSELIKLLIFILGGIELSLLSISGLFIFGLLHFKCPICSKKMRFLWIKPYRFLSICPKHGSFHIPISLISHLKKHHTRAVAVIKTWKKQAQAPPVIDLLTRTLGNCPFGCSLQNSESLGKPDKNIIHEGLTQLFYPKVGTIIDFHNKLLHAASFCISEPFRFPNKELFSCCNPIVKIESNKYFKITSFVTPCHLIQILGVPHTQELKNYDDSSSLTYHINGLIMEFTFSNKGKLFLLRVCDTSSSVISGL